MQSAYFNGKQTAKEMQKLYRNLAKQFHPDTVQDNQLKDEYTERMKHINTQFAYWYARAATDEVRETKINDKPASERYYRETYDSFFAASLEEAINWLLNNEIFTRDDLTVELVGVFIWISGEALKNEPETRQTLKHSNFRWQNARKAWFYTPTSTAGFTATDTPMDRLRQKYGSEIINGRFTQLG